jgi:hypothetical protein
MLNNFNRFIKIIVINEDYIKTGEKSYIKTIEKKPYIKTIEKKPYIKTGEKSNNKNTEKKQ